MSLNLFVANGRLVKDLELRKSQSGVSNVRFTLAVNRNRKNEQGETEADFLNCIAFNKTAELLAQYCGKGSKISIRGSLQTGSYDDKDGKKIYTTDVMVNEIEFLDSKKDAQQVQPQQLQQQYQQPNFAPPQQQQYQQPVQQQQPQYQQQQQVINQSDLPF